MKIWVLATLVSTSAAGGLAHAAVDGDRAQIVYDRRARPAEIAAAYPPAARDQKITGDVTLDCAADAQGHVVDCKVEEEKPAGLGFGAAALGLSTKEKIKPKDRNDQPVGGRRFQISYSFLAPGDSNPDWMKKPTASDLAGVFPVAAAKKGVDGAATIQCQIDIEGFLQKCKVVAEAPAGLGFGQAALQLSPQFRMKPKIRGGKPVPAGEVTIPVLWSGFSESRPTVVPGDSLVLDPPWESTPTAAQVRAAWPANAKDASAGQVALRCELAKTGMLTGCDVISEIPAGRGFGKAARSLVPAFKVRFAPDQVKELRKYSVDVPFRFRTPSDTEGRKVTKPRWTRTLTPNGMAMVYPRAAVKAGILTGVGVVACTVDVHGGLTDCEVRREDPVGLDFGAAAIEAATAISMNPWSTEGEPMDGLKLVLPIRFTWEDTPQEPSKPTKP
ncbi:hypothetical protein BH10PSE4_BH10PSE4_27480 [soil metagenome]